MKIRILVVLCFFAFVKSTIFHAQNFIPPGLTSSAVSNNTIYGYYFQAGTNFTICGLKVKYDNVATPNNQRLFVVKFTTAPVNYGLAPPFTTSTQITSFLVNSPNTAQLCNISVNAGEFIGIYGYRESACKNYFSSSSSSNLTVNAVSMPLTRSGAILSNGTCGTTPSFTGFFSEPGLPLGAIELYTNCCFTPTIGTISQPSCTSTTGSIILNGLPPGNWTLNTYLNGSTTPTSINGTGTSYTVTGLTAGAYTFNVMNAGGCTSANTSSTTINSSLFIPTASITNNSNTTILTCTQNAISLSANGTGTYSWANGTTNLGTNANLNATTPGNYTLTVTATNGCTATANLTITQNIATPGATITSPYNQLNCTLTNFNLNAIGNGTYQWSQGATILGTNSSLSINSPGTYTLTVTGSNGCTSTNNYSVTQFTGTTLSVNNPTICSGQSTSLTATPGQSGGAYTWNNSATTSSISVSPTSNTSFIVSYFINGCTTTATSNVTVNPTPIVTVNNASICPGTSTIITASGTPTGGTYLWSNSFTTNSISVSPVNTSNYTVTYNLNGCTPGTATSTISVINSLDFVNLLSPGSVAICQGQTLTIFGQVYEAGLTNVSGQAGGITVEYAYNSSNTNPSTWPAASWNSATYNSLSAGNPNNDEYMGVIPSLAPGTYYYAFRFTFNGCISYGGFSSTGGGFWDGTSNTNGTLIVNPNVTPTFNTVSSICAGSALNALPTTSTNSIVGTWSPALSNQQTTTYTFTPNPNYCALTTTQTITVNPIPIAAITAPTTSILTCTTTSISLTATGGGTYSWSNGTAVVGTNATLAVTTPGTYTVTVTAANGCTATASQIITQNVSLPTAAITAPTTSILTCSTTSISLTATGGGTYSWSNGTAVVGTNATLAVTTPGTYTVTVTAANGCTATASQVITQNISVPTAAITAPSTSI
ncbi:MAG: beta strand repeat-containing protein, partial [Flavobacteriales bacterium]